MMKRILWVLVTIPFLIQCVPAAIVAGVAASNSSKKTKAKWTSEFNQLNMERESKKLEPLDWCDEAFKVNQGWAKNDKACKEKLRNEGRL